MSKKGFRVEAEAIHSTNNALLVDIDGEEYWIPHGHILDDSEVYEVGDEGTLVISEWIAEKKGLL